MNTKTQTPTENKVNISAFALYDAYTDFILSRKAKYVSEGTLRFYEFTTGKFITWIVNQGLTTPGEVTVREVRAYLGELRDRGLKDKSLNAHARAIRTLCIFWYKEKYSPELIKFDMPKMAKRRLPFLGADEVSRLLSICNVRDNAIICLMVDSGLRRQEVCDLTWKNVNLTSGLVQVINGKGGKDRYSVIGVKARQAVIAYKRTIKNTSESDSLFQTQTGRKFTGEGLRQLFRRLEKKTGLTFTPHALRRTCVKLSLRAGMDVLHLQTILGHESLEMVQYYAQMTNDDILESHKVHSPLDNLKSLRR
jgi:site-specific recombinase XerD